MSADLPWNKEFDLMCPSNRIGAVDLFVASRHGQFSSNSEALVHAIRPRVAIVNNGIRKGGQPETMRILFTAPRMEDIWQVHVSELSGRVHSAGRLHCEPARPAADGDSRCAHAAGRTGRSSAAGAPRTTVEPIG